MARRRTPMHGRHLREAARRPTQQFAESLAIEAEAPGLRAAAQCAARAPQPARPLPAASHRWPARSVPRGQACAERPRRQ
eukprot:417531-Prymnesium_polylepis.2